MITRKKTTMAVAAFVAGGVLAVGQAGAFGFGGLHGMRGGGGGGMMFPLLVRAANPTPDQQAQIHAIMRNHKEALRPLFGQMRDAHQELAAKLLAPGPVTSDDLAPTIQKLATVRTQLMQQWTQAALEARAVLTPDQLAKAADVTRQVASLRAQIQQLVGPDASPDTATD